MPFGTAVLPALHFSPQHYVDIDCGNDDDAGHDDLAAVSEGFENQVHCGDKAFAQRGLFAAQPFDLDIKDLPGA